MEVWNFIHINIYSVCMEVWNFIHINIYSVCMEVWNFIHINIYSVCMEVWNFIHIKNNLPLLPNSCYGVALSVKLIDGDFLSMITIPHIHLVGFVIVFNATFNNISGVVVSFIGFRGTRGKSPICRQSLTNIFTYVVWSPPRLSGTGTHNVIAAIM
jgi:hypothetical protein